MKLVYDADSMEQGGGIQDLDVGPSFWDTLPHYPGLSGHKRKLKHQVKCINNIYIITPPTIQI